jgi:phosphohistidine phosphatase
VDRRRLREGFPSGSLAEFSVPGSWAGLDEGGGRLVRFVTPRDLAGE